MSESDSDCVITDVREIVKSDEYCIVYCFSSHFKEPMDKILDPHSMEFHESLVLYCIFSDVVNEGYRRKKIQLAPSTLSERVL